MTDFDSGMGLRFDFSRQTRRSSGLMLKADGDLRWQQASERFSVD